jgi:hypothetical protein
MPVCSRYLDRKSLIWLRCFKTQGQPCHWIDPAGYLGLMIYQHRAMYMCAVHGAVEVLTMDARTNMRHVFGGQSAH